MDRIEAASRATTGGVRRCCAWTWTLAVLLAGCGGGGTPAADGSAGRISQDRIATASTGTGEAAELNVFNWPDYIAEDTLQAFQKRTGIRVNYNTFSSMDVLSTAIASDPDTYDVIFPSARPLARELVVAGRLQPLDKSALSHFGNLDKSILEDLAQFDAGNAHVVPYMWGTTGIGMNTAQVRAAIGNTVPLDSWNLLFDPAIAARLSSCGIGILDDPMEPITAALIWRGKNASDRSAESLDQVKRDFMAIRPYVRKFTGSSELIADLAAGDLCIVISYSGDVIQAQTIAAEREGGPEIAYVIPREGALRWTDVIAIPKNAKHPKNAHTFIDYLMEAETIAAITNYVAYANANSASAALVDKAIAEDPAIYPPPAVQAKLAGMGELSAEDTARQKTTWIKIVYGDM